MDAEPIRPPMRTDRSPIRPAMNAAQGKRVKEAIINPTVVRNRRRALGLSQVQLAIMSATSTRTIALIERGRQLDPATSVTLRIAKALSVTVEALCAENRAYSGRTARAYDAEVGR